MEIKEMIQFARGGREVDLLLKNAQLVNCFSGEIKPQAIAIAQGMVVGFGDYPASKVIDLKGRFLAPGFIDAHVHIESSMVGVGSIEGIEGTSVNCDFWYVHLICSEKFSIEISIFHEPPLFSLQCQDATTPQPLVCERYSS